MVNQLFARLARDRAGNTAILATFALTSIVGAAGLGTDTIQWTLMKRQLQRQADSAALAGALAVAQGGSGTSAATTEIARYSNVTLSATPTIEIGPSVGAYAGNSKAVRVVVSAQKKLPFSSFFLDTAPVLTGEATAAQVGFGEYCVVSLENTSATGVTFWGNTDVNLGCGVISNSQGSTAVNAGGSSSVTASPIAAVGGIPSTGNYASGTVFQPYSTAQGDPFASLPNPVVPASCEGQLSVSNKGITKIDNSTGVRCFAGMNIKGRVTFDPGVYIINGGSISSNANGDISGSGVTFILTGPLDSSTGTVDAATVDINGNATIDLTAPSSGTYSGVLFYQDRRATLTSSTLSGNSSSRLQGAVYFPKASLTFTGNSGMVTDCLQLVARQITFTGSSAIANSCPSNSGTTAITGVKVRLVS